MRMPVRRTARFLAALALCGAAGAQAETIATGMVAAANPLAAAAGLDALKRGGSVVDAAIAVQMVLTVVEPQSSGLGGGTLMLVWDQDGGTLSALDGLAAAPARTTASLRTDVDGATLPLKDVARLGRPVGVPGTVRVMALAHQRHGKLPWASLFQAGIHSAEDGFPMSPYLHDSLQRLPQLAENPAIRNVFYDARGQVLPVGATVRNPLLADALRKVAADPDAINHGVLTADVLAAIGAGKYPSLIQAADLAAYRPVERTPICGPFLSWKVCTFPPPSFGGVSVLQQLGMLAAHRIDTLAPGSAAADHLLIDTARIARADRLAYIGDPAQVKAPVRQLIAPGYVRERAALLSGKAVTGPRPGTFAGVPAPAGADAPGTTETSQVAIVDARGNALSMTHHHQPELRLMADAARFLPEQRPDQFLVGPRQGRAQRHGAEQAASDVDGAHHGVRWRWQAGAGDRISRRRLYRRLHRPGRGRHTGLGAAPRRRAGAAARRRQQRPQPGGKGPSGDRYHRAIGRPRP